MEESIAVYVLASVNESVKAVFDVLCRRENLCIIH